MKKKRKYLIISGSSCKDNCRFLYMFGVLDKDFKFIVGHLQNPAKKYGNTQF